MQGSEIREGMDEEGQCPHLTQRSARVDHLALWENKAREEIYYLQLVFIYILKYRGVFFFKKRITRYLFIFLIQIRNIQHTLTATISAYAYFSF